MPTAVETSEIIDRIYDVAVDPERYEAMLDAWERRLSVLRLEAEAQSRPQIARDADIETHVDRAGIFLQRLYDAKPGAGRSPLDLDVKAAFLVGRAMRIEQVNRAAEQALGLRSGDPLDRLPLVPEDVAAIRGAIRKAMALDGGDPLLLRCLASGSDRSVIFHIARQPAMEDGSICVMVRTTEVGWPEHLSQTMRDAFALTRAEVDIVRALAEGKSLRDIATSSKRSTETIKSHLAAVLGKTGTRSQAELIRITLGLMDVVGATAAREQAATIAQQLSPIPYGTLRTADGRRYDWIEFGAPEGRPLLYLPLDYGMIRWPRAAEVAAARRGIRIVVPIRAGYGHSSPLPRGNRSYAEATGADLKALLDHLGIQRCAVLTMGADFRFALALAACTDRRVTGIYGCSATLPILTAKQYERMGKWHRFILARS